MNHLKEPVLLSCFTYGIAQLLIALGRNDTLLRPQNDKFAE